MDHYVDIRLLPDAEFAPTLLMSALFGKLHRGLVDYGGQDIGVSFPDVAETRTLGSRLRLHGTEKGLQRLMQLGWMQGMRDHAEFGRLQRAPDGARHRVVRRVQAKSSPERLRRRLMSRKQIDAATALRAIPDSVAETLSLPHVVLTSATTGQRFKLFVEHGPVRDAAVLGIFGTYGLSASATVPWF